MVTLSSKEELIKHDEAEASIKDSVLHKKDENMVRDEPIEEKRRVTIRQMDTRSENVTQTSLENTLEINRSRLQEKSPSVKKTLKTERSEYVLVSGSEHHSFFDEPSKKAEHRKVTDLESSAKNVPQLNKQISQEQQTYEVSASFISDNSSGFSENPIPKEPEYLNILDQTQAKDKVVPTRIAESIHEQLAPQDSTILNDPQTATPSEAISTLPASFDALHLAQASMSELPIATEYALKPIDWIDTRTGTEKNLRVITQNENGPCPLIALCNVLLLRGDIEIRPPGKSHVSFEELVGILGDYLLNTMSHTQTQEHIKSEQTSAQALPSVGDFRHNLNAALSVIPRLQTGLDVNVYFRNIRGFEPTEELALFDVFGVDLVHGWVVDPEEEVFHEVLVKRCGSYNRAVEVIVRGDEVRERKKGCLSTEDDSLICDALVASQFLNSTATQLTHFGLNLLHTIPSSTPCVLFRNNHFSTLIKNSSTLYTLVTDASFVGERKVVWESLLDLDQSTSEFFDGKFSRADAAADYVGLDEGTEFHFEGDPSGDADFALALQLQEEEEHHLREQQRREQERQLTREHQATRIQPHQQNEAQQSVIPLTPSQSTVTTSVATATAVSTSSSSRQSISTAKNENGRKKGRKKTDDCVIS
ncbi:uncharacterized protein VTP21DRAFT_8053 [Calcarisporiella thermophila]|uniref:uncharacterized protein n=1 Tax=Calcarisporiella thermophila TaxID=911321 RepID=UPI0037432CF8